MTDSSSSSLDQLVIFFDVGGTLLRPAKPIGDTYARVASHYGAKVSADDLDKGFKRAWTALKPRDPIRGARVMDDKGWWKDLVLKAWDGLELPERFPFDDYFEELYAAFEDPRLWRVYPEVEGVLDELAHMKIRCAVLSNWDQRLRSILKSMELAAYFETLIISSEVGAEKPHEKIFKHAEKEMSVSPANAVLIGDESRFDQEGAVRAGWRYGIVNRPEVDLRDALVHLKILF